MKKIFVTALLLFAPLAWMQGDEIIVSPENPLAHVSSNPGFCSIFHKWGFIGDSLCSGEQEYKKADGKTGYLDLYDYSWGQRMCALMGVSGDNYSKGGETARGWISHFWEKPNNHNNNIDAKTDPKQAYIMALGVNDNNPKNKMLCGCTETDIDTLDYHKNKDTFIGNYGGIIQRVRSIAPKSVFFLVTMPTPRDAHFNVEIRKMAKIFPRCYIIDLEKYGPDYKQGSTFRERFYMGGHLNAAGYEYTAWMFLTYINWLIEHNWDDFRQAALIGTPHEWHP